MAVNDTKVCDPLYKLFGGAVAAASPAGDLTSASKKKTPGVAERTVAGAFLPIFHFRFSKELLSTLKIISCKTDLGTFAFLLVWGCVHNKRVVPMRKGGKKNSRLFALFAKSSSFLLLSGKVA